MIHLLVMVAMGRERHTPPGGCSRLPHSIVASSYRSCHGATTHLNPIARSLQSDEERAAPNQHALAGTCRKISADPSLYSW
jgi:hypothetical protein